MSSRGGVPTKILVGTDGSVTATRALDRAIAMAGALGAELNIVTAFNDRAPTGVPSAGVTLDSGWAAAARSAAEKVADEAGQRARDAGLGTVTAEALAGDPATVLLQSTTAHSVDLLVVGSKGMQSTARFLLGPIANKVSRKVDCDLLIVETSDSSG